MRRKQHSRSPGGVLSRKVVSKESWRALAQRKLVRVSSEGFFGKSSLQGVLEDFFRRKHSARSPGSVLSRECSLQGVLEDFMDRKHCSRSPGGFLSGEVVSKEFLVELNRSALELQLERNNGIGYTTLKIGAISFFFSDLFCFVLDITSTEFRRSKTELVGKIARCGYEGLTIITNVY